MPQLNRRQLLKTGSVLSAAALLPACSWRRVAGANSQLRVAMVGAGGIANGQAIPHILGENALCPCFADVDASKCEKAFESFPGALHFQDYRKMFDAQHREFDAVIVSTPDHHHFPATMLAMQAGKHVYTQKPLTHTVEEARQINLMHEQSKLATQMGNQFHAGEGIRRVVEWVRSGKLGEITHASVWTDRPNGWWPQGHKAVPSEKAVPAGLDWDVWLGPAPVRPYEDKLHPFSWRGTRDFGTGALGDMGCHVFDAVFWALGLSSFEKVALLEGTPVRDGNAWPLGSKVRFTFKDGLTVDWSENGVFPAVPCVMPESTDKNGNKQRLKLKQGGIILKGTKATLVSFDHYGIQFAVVANDATEKSETITQRHPKGESVEMLVGDVGTAPARSLARSEGHHAEWFAACRGEKPWDYPRANFSYAAPFTETLLAACLVQVTGGELQYDGKVGVFKGQGSELANQLASKTYRNGWDYRL